MLQRVEKIYIVEYCDFFKMTFAKILDFWRKLNSLWSSQMILVMTVKDKTIIEYYFLLPDF